MANCEFKDICDGYGPSKCWFYSQIDSARFNKEQSADILANLRANSGLETCINRASVCRLLEMNIKNIGKFNSYGVEKEKLIGSSR